MVRPSEIAARVFISAASITRLPEVFAQISSASRMGTPLEIIVPPDRSYEIEVSKAGYEMAVREVRAVPGEAREVAVTLAPLLGEVRVVEGGEIRYQNRTFTIQSCTLLFDSATEIRPRFEACVAEAADLCPKCGAPPEPEPEACAHSECETGGKLTAGDRVADHHTFV